MSQEPEPLAVARQARPAASRRVCLADVAREAGVSRTVAGKVLNGGNDNSRVAPATAERIVEVARKLRYSPNPAARQLRGKRTQTYGVLVASAGDPLRSFLVQHLDIEAAKVGCHTIIGNTIGRDEPNHFSYYVEEFARRGVDGVFCAVHDWFAGSRQALLAAHPRTVFYEDVDVAESRRVEVDRRAAVRIAVEHLLATGRRRIGLAITDLTKASNQARIEGFREALEEHGQAFDESFVFSGEAFGGAFAVHDEQSLTWRYPIDVVDRSIDVLVRDVGVDAIVAHDDFWAATLIRRLRARGLAVPHDVAIVGYLNHYLADWTDPPLTTIDLQHGVAAQRMVAMMEAMVEQGESPVTERRSVVAPKLVRRGST